MFQCYTLGNTSSSVSRIESKKNSHEFFFDDRVI